MSTNPYQNIITCDYLYQYILLGPQQKKSQVINELLVDGFANDEANQALMMSRCKINSS